MSKKPQQFTIKAKDAEAPLVLGLDVGSTGSRAAVYDRHGRPLDDVRIKMPHAFTTTSDGGVTIDADQVVDELRRAIDHVCAAVRGPIAAVGFDTFASSLVGVDADGNALTPCITYADSRCTPDVETLRAGLDEDDLQQTTGTRLHPSYLPARLAWMQRTDAATARKVARWMSLGEYVWSKLLGVSPAGTATAAWTGLLDRATGTWDAELIEHSGGRPEQFGNILDPDTPVQFEQPLPESWAPLKDAQWFAPVADGIGAQLGVGGLDDTTMVVSLGTSGAVRVLVDQPVDTLPEGLWCYRIDARRSLLGGAINDVGRATAWMEQVLAPIDGHELADALDSDPVETTPLVTPFFTGERSTGWAGQARAAFEGVQAATTSLDLRRAVLEGIALAFLRTVDQLREVAPNIKQVHVGGRVGRDAPGLLRLLADALQMPVTPVPIKRSTLHGIALMVLDVIDPGTDRTPPDADPVVMPVEGRGQYYRDRLARFEKLRDATLPA